MTYFSKTMHLINIIIITTSKGHNFLNRSTIIKEKKKKTGRWVVNKIDEFGQ